MKDICGERPGGVAAGAGPEAAIAGRDNGRTVTLLGPMLDRLFRPDYAALAGGTGQRAAGVFAGGRDLAVDREAALRILRSHTDLAAGDRRFLAQMVAARTGLLPADAKHRVATVETEARAAPPCSFPSGS